MAKKFVTKASQPGLIGGLKPKSTPGTPGFNNAPKPKITLPPKPKVTTTPKPTPKKTKKPIPKVTATPKVVVPNNPEFRGSYPPAVTKQPVKPKVTPKPTVTKTPTPKPKKTETPKPKKTQTPKLKKTNGGAIFGYGK